MIYNDPGLLWPEIPVLNERVQLFYDNGVVVYGGTRGPFKINGEKSFQVCNKLIELLENNRVDKKTHFEFIQELSGEENGNELVYFYNMLYQNGFLAIEGNSLEEKYLSNLNSYTKNFRSFQEIDENRKSIRFNIDPVNEFSQSIIDFLELKNISVNHDEYNWKLVQVNTTEDIVNLNIDKKNILIFNTTEGTVLGPVISRNAVSIDHALEIFDKFKVIDIEKNDVLIQTVSLILFKYTMKLSEYFLDKYFLKISDTGTNYESVYDYIDTTDFNVIQKFEFCSAFSASDYSHRKSHLTHYKSKNLKISRLNYTSPFWKKIDNNIPNVLIEFFEILVGFKRHNNNKKYTPTGGNLNSNMLFYVNLNNNHLDGKGIYFFENTKKQLFQISDNISTFTDVDIDNEDGMILIGSNIDTISEKYGDFSFKIGNLNLGVVLATYALVREAYKEKITTQLRNIPNEVVIKSQLGMELTNLLFEFGIGVKLND